MEKKRRAYWENYASVLLPLMGLPQWAGQIVVKKEACHDMNFAEFRGIYGQTRGELRLCREWDTLPPAKQRECMVHELEHARHHAIDTYVLNRIKKFMQEADSAIFFEEYEHHMEFVVHSTATSEMVKSLPLPSPKGEDNHVEVEEEKEQKEEVAPIPAYQPHCAECGTKLPPEPNLWFKSSWQSGLFCAICMTRLEVEHKAKEMVQPTPLDTPLCPECGTEMVVSSVEGNVESAELEYGYECPRCTNPRTRQTPRTPMLPEPDELKVCRGCGRPDIEGEICRLCAQVVGSGKPFIAGEGTFPGRPYIPTEQKVYLSPTVAGAITLTPPYPDAEPIGNLAYNIPTEQTVESAFECMGCTL